MWAEWPAPPVSVPFHGYLFHDHQGLLEVAHANDQSHARIPQGFPDGTHAGMTAQRLQIGPHHAGGRLFGKHREIDIGPKRHAARVDTQNGQPRFRVGTRKGDLEIETARPQQGGVNLVQAVGGGQDGHPLQILDAIHFGQKLGHNPIGPHRLVPPPARGKGGEFIEKDDAPFAGPCGKPPGRRVRIRPPTCSKVVVP